MKIENIFYFSIFFLLLFRTIFVQLFGILYLAFDFKIYFIFDFIFFMLTFLMVRFWTGTWIMAHWQNVLQILSVALFNPDIFCRRLLFSIDGFIFSSMIFCRLFILYFFRVSWWTFFFPVILRIIRMYRCVDHQAHYRHNHPNFRHTELKSINLLIDVTFIALFFCRSSINSWHFNNRIRIRKQIDKNSFGNVLSKRPSILNAFGIFESTENQFCWGFLVESIISVQLNSYSSIFSCYLFSKENHV